VVGALAAVTAVVQQAWKTEHEAVSAGSPLPKPVVPQQLEARVPEFAGRTEELGQLDRWLEESDRPGGTAMIAVIQGTAGVGKTELAKHWAHRVTDRFEHGVLYVDLLAFSATLAPKESARAIQDLLAAFDVPAATTPISLEAQEAKYRSLLATRQVLVVLDNAASSRQVKPLLPSSRGCAAVVTSRSHLDLISAGAHLLPVPLFSEEEARQLLTSRLGADRVAAEPEAVDDIITRCARLPLALAIVIARAVPNRKFTLTALAAELDKERMQALATGEDETSVKAVFSWSYQKLDPPEARLFRLLGLHPGPDFTRPAAASLAAASWPNDAPNPLIKLTRASLIDEHLLGRFTFHDLLRDYAKGESDACDGAAQNAAQLRILDHYLHSAHAAWGHSYPHLQQALTLASPQSGVVPEKPANRDAAQAWFAAEYLVLLATIQLAADTGHPTHAWQLAYAMVPFFERQGHWHDFAATHETALTAARQHQDRRGQAQAHLGVGRARARQRRLTEARTQLQDALGLFVEFGDLAGQSDAHYYLGMTFHSEENYDQALHYLQEASDLAVRGEYREGQATSLSSLGWIYALLGDTAKAIDYSQRSLDLLQDLSDLWGEAATLNTIGYVLRRDDPGQAATYFEQAIQIDKKLGDLYSEAVDFDHLGDARDAAGQDAEAQKAWERSLEILDGFPDVTAISTSYPDKATLRAKLGLA